VLFVGASLQYGISVAGEVGLGVRFGYPRGVFLGGSWSPASFGGAFEVAAASVKLGFNFYHFVALWQLLIVRGGGLQLSVGIGHGF
jgi:hypothetical protein